MNTPQNRGIPASKQDEIALLAQVRRLDQQALERVHDVYYPALFRYIAYKVGDHETAEDLTSEVFTRLLSAVRDRHAPQNSLRGWLYGVASKVVADYHRKQYRMQKVSLDERIASDIDGPAETVARQLSFEQLHEQMAELTDEQRDVLAMRFGYGMPIREVAETIGKSEGAVKQLQARAVASLSRKLTDWSGE